MNADKLFSIPSAIADKPMNLVFAFNFIFNRVINVSKQKARESSELILCASSIITNLTFSRNSFPNSLIRASVFSCVHMRTKG